MGLLNLTLAELLAVLLPLSGLLVALYFYQRIRRRQVVSTLRFWPRRALGIHKSRRRKLHQPLSLLLQLLALLFLLLAVADPFLGSRASLLRQHVLILETSAWMNARSGGVTLMERARERALAYLRALPGIDAQRIGLIGHSGGSSLGNLVVRLEPHFAAYVSDHEVDFRTKDFFELNHCEIVPGLFPLHRLINDLSTAQPPVLRVRYSYGRRKWFGLDRRESRRILDFFVANLR